MIIIGCDTLSSVELRFDGGKTFFNWENKEHTRAGVCPKGCSMCRRQIYQRCTSSMETQKTKDDFISSLFCLFLLFSNLINPSLFVCPSRGQQSPLLCCLQVHLQMEMH